MTDCVAANELRDELGGLVGLIGGSAWPRYQIRLNARCPNREARTPS
jgi:hypothetical protein